VNIQIDRYGYVTDEVSTIKVNESNLNEENRIKFVTDLAVISRGKSESKNPKSTYKRLLKEAAPNKIGGENNPSRPLEFGMVVINKENLEIGSTLVLCCNQEFTFEDFNRDVLAFSYLKEGTLFTNLRALIIGGVKYENIPYNTIEEMKDARALKLNLPMFSWAQLNTHTRLSMESISDRIVSQDETTNHWFPKDLMRRVNTRLTKWERFKYFGIYFVYLDIDLGYFNMWDKKLVDQQTVQDLYKRLGYDKGVYSRMPYYSKYKSVIATGFRNDPRTWTHLMIERNAFKEHKNWTDVVIAKYVKEGIKPLILKD